MTKISKGKRCHLLALCLRGTGPVFDFRLIDAVSPLAAFWNVAFSRLDAEITRHLLAVSP